MKAQELVVCKNFKLVRKLGTGAFGEIYLAENRTNPLERYAAKLEETSSKFPQLYFEAKMYKYLHSFGPAIGIPKVHAVTTEGQYNVMLMDLLGPSLEDLFTEQGKKLSLKTVLQLGEQMIERLELLHDKNILHRDIKPDNFLMGIGKHAPLVFIVDFGLSKKYIQENKHIPYKEGKELTGTARYASINTHMGIEQSRRDDIESVGYVLMYLLRGILPWQNMKAKDTKTKYKMIMEKKIATPAEFLCKGFPPQMALFINYAKGLKFEEKPDYKYLRSLLVTARKANLIEADFQYDWTAARDLASKDPPRIEPPRIEPPRIEPPRLEPSRFQPPRIQPPRFQSKESSRLEPGKKTEQASDLYNGLQPRPKDIANSINFANPSSKPIAPNNKISAFKNPGLFSSTGLESIVPAKVPPPKISLIKR